MSTTRKRIVGFGISDDAVAPEQETKTDYVQMALDEYLKLYQPYDRDNDGFCENKTSREIQEDIKDVVTASISTITEYMAEHGYRLEFIEGGKLAWRLQYKGLA